MIVYLDASALIKRYVAEAGSDEVAALIGEGSAIGTAIISRAEVVAALTKAVRMKLLARADATSALQVFRADWEKPHPLANDGVPRFTRRSPRLGSRFARLRRCSSGIGSLLAGYAGRADNRRML